MYNYITIYSALEAIAIIIIIIINTITYIQQEIYKKLLKPIKKEKKHYSYILCALP